MARKNVGTIGVDVDAQTAGVKKADADVARATKKMGRNFNRARQQAIKFGNSVRNLARRLTSLRAIGALVGGAFLGGQLREYTKAGASMYELSLRTGATVSELERLKLGLQADGAEAEKVSRIISTLTARFDEAAFEGGEYARMLERVGLSAREIQLESVTGKFRRLGEAVADFRDAGGDALGFLRQLTGERVTTGLTALFERGRLQRNIDETLHIQTPTTAEAEKIKAVDQAFTDLGNTIKNSLLITLADFDGGLKGLSRFLETNIPIWGRALAGQLPETATRAGQLGLAAAGAVGVSQASNIWRTISTLARGGVRSIPKSTPQLAGAALFLSAIAVAVEQFGDISARIEREVDYSVARNPKYWGKTLSERINRITNEIAHVEAEIASSESILRAGQVTVEGDWRYPAPLLAELKRVHVGQYKSLPTEESLSAARELRDVLLDVKERFIDSIENIPKAPPVAPAQRAIPQVSGFQYHGSISEWEMRTAPRTVMTALQWAAQENKDWFKEFEAGYLEEKRILSDRQEAELTEAQMRINEFARDAAHSFEELVFSITGGLDNIRDAFADFLSDLARSAFRQTVTEPLGDWLGAVIGRRAGGGYASGLTLVGETGPELVDFRSPAQVYSSQRLGMALRGGGGAAGVVVNYSPTISAFDANGVDAVLRESEERFVERMKGEIIHDSGYSNSLSQSIGRRL